MRQNKDLTTYRRCDYNGGMVKVALYVHGDDMKKFKALAKKRRVKTSLLIRFAMAEYLERNKE
jgi:hypothetical protein